MKQHQHLGGQAHSGAHTGTGSGYNYPRYDATPEASTSSDQVLQHACAALGMFRLRCSMCFGLQHSCWPLHEHGSCMSSIIHPHVALMLGMHRRPAPHCRSSAASAGAPW